MTVKSMLRIKLVGLLLEESILTEFTKSIATKLK